MIDAIAAVAVVGGALLTALGGVGLLRFPDVFTRMHAATKAATVGVIGTTAAAAIEAGALSGFLVLLLVVVLLFLSGPLGMSLLARAAYHDPETPRLAVTQELELPIPESTSAKRAGGTSWFLALWLFVAWIALFGSVRPNVVLGGLAVAGLATVTLRSLAPRWPRAFLRPVALLRFTVHFAGQLATATWDVIRLLFVPSAQLRPAVVDIPLLVHTRNEVKLLMNAVSFTPGTIALELHGDRMYVHVMSPRPSEGVIAEINTMQRLIHDAFGSTTGERHSNHATGDV